MGGPTHRQLVAFETAVSRLWADYIDQGPGRVAAERYDVLQSAYEPLQQAAMPHGLQAQVQTLHELAARCVQRPEGLCFVSGEAGLVPRTDLHSAFEQALGGLRDHLAASHD